MPQFLSHLFGHKKEKVDISGPRHFRHLAHIHIRRPPPLPSSPPPLSPPTRFRRPSDPPPPPPPFPHKRWSSMRKPKKSSKYDSPPMTSAASIPRSFSLPLLSSASSILLPQPPVPSANISDPPSTANDTPEATESPSCGAPGENTPVTQPSSNSTLTLSTNLSNHSLPEPHLSTITPEVAQHPKCDAQNESTPVLQTLTPPISKTPLPPIAPIPVVNVDFTVNEEGLEIFYETDYTHIKSLQVGGQGTVELVSTKFYKRVALKKFDRKAITHPNIVQTRGVLFESPTERDIPKGVFMEFMDGGSVCDAIYDPNMAYPTSTALNWCRQAASGLAFLHRRKLIHRDVKPPNMLLCDGRKKLKISDFGICTRALSEMTADVGTVVYMAPEVITICSTSSTYDDKCDVYSLGISLWEMLHRTRPHESLSFLTVMNAVREGSRPTIDGMICESDLKTLIERMWSENSEDRPDMGEVHEEVEKMLDMMGFFDNYWK